jgi:hypothetical protein
MPLFSYLSFSGIGDSGLVACDRIGMGYKGGLRAGKGGAGIVLDKFCWISDNIGEIMLTG